MEVETTVGAHEPADDPPHPLRYFPALQPAHEPHASDPDDVLNVPTVHATHEPADDPPQPLRYCPLPQLDRLLHGAHTLSSVPVQAWTWYSPSPHGVQSGGGAGGAAVGTPDPQP